MSLERSLMFLNHLDEITQLSANIGAQVVHYLQRCIILPGLGDIGLAIWPWHTATLYLA